MFWRFGGYANISSLDTILDKPDVTVEELLDESDLIQELKQQNSKLIEFLREEPVLHKLLRYVVADKPLEDVTPSLGDSEKSSGISLFGRGKSRSRSKSVNKSDNDETEEDKKEAQRKKYAYVSCEVLSSEVWSITEALLDSRDQLRKFWEYIRRPAPLDALQAGYFTKVNEALLDKKTGDMLAFIKSLDNIVPAMLQHVDCPMVMDLLLKIISLEKHEEGQGIVDWLQMQGLVPQLLSYLSPEHPSATQTSAGDFLKAIITISANATAQDQSVIGPNELTRQLVSEQCVSTLISDMLRGGNPLTVGVGIIIEVIRKNNSDYDLDNQIGPEPKTSDPIYLGTLLRQFAKHVPDFMRLIRSPSAKKPDLKTAFGDKVEPLGFDRFKTCELMAELLHCSNMGLLNERGSEAEIKRRDAERERLKAEGKLSSPQLPSASQDDPFGSSVDSHGFHHARKPEDDLSESPEEIKKLEVQNGMDEDGYEKVAVPETEALPDEVSFDDFNEKIEELTPLTKSDNPMSIHHGSEKSDLSSGKPNSPPAQSLQFDPPPTEPSEPLPSVDISDKFSRLDISPDEQIAPEAKPEGKRRVSLLTQQLQDQIEESELSPVTDQHLAAEPDSELRSHPEDKPAPLSISPKKEKVAKPLDEEHESTTESTATLQPESSHATNPGDERDDHETDVDGTPVVGDLLKMMFVEHQVVPTILDFFFRFPWNNFLHNVVYDVVQQVFNGTLDRGYNRTLALDLFCKSSSSELASAADVTQRILDGQLASEVSQKEKGMRLGYMGHLTLIAEEVCKFAERHPPEVLGEQVMERIMREEWIRYVEGTLSETRDRDNAVLGGVRPENAMSVRQMGVGGGLLGQSGFSASNNNNSNALANAGLGGAPADSLALVEAAENSGYEINSGSSGLLSGFGDGEEDEELEEEAERDRRTAAVSDDEQTSLSPNPAHVPPPLNVPPSRAREKLAARLAARNKAPQAVESDPDAADPAALETAAELPDEPLGDVEELDFGPAAERELQEAGLPGLQLSGSRMKGVPRGGTERFSRLFQGSDSDDTSSSGSSSEEADEGQGEEQEERRGMAGLVRQRSQKERKRRPSTTEAKVRRPLDDEEMDFGGDGQGSVSASAYRAFAHEGESESPFADPVEMEQSDDEEEEEDDDEDTSDDEDIVEIRPRRPSGTSA